MRNIDPRLVEGICYEYLNFVFERVDGKVPYMCDFSKKDRKFIGCYDSVNVVGERVNWEI